MRIALNGFGRVGQALFNLIKEQNENIEIVYIGRSESCFVSEEGISIKEFGKIEDIKFYPKSEKNLKDIIPNLRVDFWFEMTPTKVNEAEEVCNRLENILKSRINVVLANKCPFLHNYLSLKRAADESGVEMGLSAVMGASLPSYAIGHYGTMGSKVKEMSGILNGTSNFVLKQMEEGKSFNEAISKAIEDGIAEPEYSYDIDGIDSAVKMMILASVIENKNIELDMKNVTGLRSIADEDFKQALKDGMRYKLVAKYENGIVSVSPQKFSNNYILYHVNGSDKALRIETDTLSDMTVLGGKSGLNEVAASMYRDMLLIKENREKIRQNRK